MTTAEPLRAGGSLWLIAYRGLTDGLAKSVMFVITIAAARTLSRADVGAMAFAMTVGWLASVVADSGMQMHIAREAAQRPASIGTTLARWLPLRLWSGFACSAIAVAVIAAESAHGFVPGALLALAYGLSGVTEYLFHLFRGLRRTDLESTLTLVQRGALALTALAVFTWRPTLLSLSVAFLLSSVGTLGIALHLARTLTPPPDGAGPPQSTWREFVTSILPIGAGVVLSALYFRVDVFLLGLWRGADDVAAYNAVFRLVEAMRLVPAAVLAVQLPALFTSRNASLLTRLSLTLALTAAVVVAGLWPFATPLVSFVYGPAYADAGQAFRILLLSFPPMALNYALTSQLIGWHGHRAYAIVCGGALAVNLLLNARLIGTLGIDGAAWATLWTEAVLTVGCVAALARVPAADGCVPAAAMEGH